MKCSRLLRNSTRNAHRKCEPPSENINAMNIQMLNDFMKKQLFPHKVPINATNDQIEKCKNDLKKYNLWNENITTVKTPNIKLPSLEGENLDEHFQKIASQSSGLYLSYLELLAYCNLPEMPQKWSKKSGWTRYINQNGKTIMETIEYPCERAMVFDCEVLVTLSDEPIMAVAVSPSHWYSWASKRIQQKTAMKNTLDLIPLETTSKDKSMELSDSIPRVIVGHNVSYDRARVKEQFYFNKSKIRFVDTLSMHVAIGGLISSQQQIAMSYKKLKKDLKETDDDVNTYNWLGVGSLNNLSDVHNLYCGSEIQKDARDTFVKGNINDVKSDFQNLMKYCANDVASTHNVLKEMFPLFKERFPHDVTFAGMLEMGQMILPINSNWNKYIDSSELAYQELSDELQHILSQFANEACHKNQEYKTDLWLWDLDWETQNINLLKSPRKNAELPKSWFNQKAINTTTTNIELTQNEMNILGKTMSPEFQPSPYFEKILTDTYVRLPKIHKKMPGYPKWYRELCLDRNDKDWKLGPVQLSPLKRIVPKLLNITWRGFPLHFVIGHGWGFLADQSLNYEHQSDVLKNEFEVDENNNENGTLASKHVLVPDLPLNKSFYKIVHKDGRSGNIGSIFSKSMQAYVENENVISSANHENAIKCLKINAACSYWRSSRNRLASQRIRFHKNNCLPKDITSHSEYNSGMLYGSIIPIVAVSGTITRRAVEKTWLTASNIIYNRIGSELKGMVCAPPGYCFVGADVDSQELWIASLLGDTMSAGIHGCTPLSWMTLQGEKSSSTDLHSKTAAAIGITRDQAKAFNYGRIYGGGKKLALSMMKAYNPSLEHNEAVKKVNNLFEMTKGQLKYNLTMQGMWFAKQLKLKYILQKQAMGETISEKDVYYLLKIAKKHYGKIDDIHWSNLVKPGMYYGGMESDMFNKLSSIANNSEPETPVLKCRLSKALEPSLIKKQFGLSRNNWVVQSSAVDFLHLLIVSMDWLIRKYKLNARFAISIHDELHYLCHEEDKYKVALALQISNLLTRGMFTYKLGVDDLPHAVSYFSSIEIDKVLRKDVNDDCKTLSNPMGLMQTYGIPFGESLTLQDILNKTKDWSF